MRPKHAGPSVLTAPQITLPPPPPPAFAATLAPLPVAPRPRWAARATSIPPGQAPAAPGPGPLRRAQRRPSAPVVAPVFVSENVCDAWDWTPVTPGLMWRLLLMSDGHLEGHLQALARGTLRLELVETALALEAEEGGGSWVEVPAVADGMAWPRRRRQVRLVGADGVALVHATSVWDAALYDRVMGPDEGRTIWEALHAARFGTARRVLGVRYGRCAELGRVFGCEEGSMMWSREMLLKRERRPMVVVSEILSPRLEEYVGPMTAPTDGYFELLARNIEEISVS